MKKILLMLPLIFLLAAASAGAHKIEDPGACQQCGMDRAVYAHSRMIIVFADGSRVGTCSLHCTASELKEHPGKRATSLLAADYYSKKLIDAGKATWVVGGDKQGVMTATPKWAFESREGAGRFIAANGGKVATFDEALAMAGKE